MRTEQTLQRSLPMGTLSGVRLERFTSGLCVWCGKPRGTDGTTWYCRLCAQKQVKHAANARASRIERRVCIDCKQPNKRAAMRCQDCSRAAWAKGAQTALNATLIRKYGITLQRYRELSARQGGVCAICLQPETIRLRLSVDHCHDSGAVRGLLCAKCNAGIGSLQDSVVVVERALLYLKAFQRPTP